MNSQVSFDAGTYTLADGTSLTGSGTGAVSIAGATVNVADRHGDHRGIAFSVSGGTIGGAGTLTTQRADDLDGRDDVGHGHDQRQRRADARAAAGRATRSSSAAARSTTPAPPRWPRNTTGYGLYLAAGATFDNKPGASLRLHHRRVDPRARRHTRTAAPSSTRGR